jgi:hypothetical protein
VISLLLRLGGWISRNLLWIIVSIVLCTLVLHSMAEISELKKSIGAVENAQTSLRSGIAQLEEQAKAEMARLEGLGSAALDKKIAEVAKDIAERQASIKTIGMTLTIDEIVQKARLQLEIEVLRQERRYLERLRGIVFADEVLERLRTASVNLNAAVQAELKALNALDARMRQWNVVQRGRSHVDPFSDEYKIAQRRDSLDQSIRKHSQLVIQCVEQFKVMKANRDQRPSIGPFTLKDGWADAALAGLDKRRAALQSKFDGHWLEKAKRAVFDEAQGPYAKQATKYVVFGAIGAAIAWVLIRLLFYFVLAPAASRAAPIRLLPNSNGSAKLLRRPRSEEAGGGEGASASLTVQVEPGQLLAIRPEYFHGASGGCAISTRDVINRRCLRSSLAAGLYNLTQVEVQSPATVTVSAGHEPLQQLALLDIPSGSAVAIQPEHVLGAIHHREAPVRITRHLRLLNLQAWLTLQFRYLVFHGPVQLILKGCRGIKAEAVEIEQTIDRAYTVGFSANLSYGVVEAETFPAYLTRKKRLLRDRFRGGPGMLISEESPSGSKRMRSGKRGLDDLADSAVNVAGAVTGGR